MSYRHIPSGIQLVQEHRPTEGARSLIHTLSLHPPKAPKGAQPFSYAMAKVKPRSSKNKKSGTCRQSRHFAKHNSTLQDHANRCCDRQWPGESWAKKSPGSMGNALEGRRSHYFMGVLHSNVTRFLRVCSFHIYLDIYHWAQSIWMMSDYFNINFPT